jgi:L-rhamnose mutarotase
MEVYAVRTRLKAGMEEAYEQVHRVVPDDVAADLTRRGFLDWQIFRHGQDLFHVITAAGPEALTVDEHSQEIADRWLAEVRPYLDLLDDGRESADMTRVWRMADNIARPKVCST